ncbi:uncharacterized protein LOC131284734 [Anopheles ziemanni]|uniref:uncharacterized protein LOC131284734 n=1 Tax=Anopheles ziemanni TaxID=345580 RepID=UPI0026603DE7|nr:uncharacterized protein LOC131284734 [Anopheles ziemanni]
MALKKREIQVDSEKVRGKKSKKLDFSQEVISEYEPENLTESGMVDGKKDYHEVATEPVSENGKKSKKKARILAAQEVNEETDLCNPVNEKKAKKKVPAKDLAVDDEEQLAEPPTKKIKKEKKKAAIPNVLDAVDPFEKYRQPHEAADHWQLRRMFLEQNFDILPEDELECLAQVFINVELLRCDYPPETMARLEELSGGISAKYHEQRRYGPHRTLVSATYVAALKAQRKELVIPKKVEDASTEATLHLDGVKNGPDPFVPIDRPQNLTEMLQNVIVINDCFEATLSASKPLNRECGFEFTEHEQRGGFLFNVKAHVGGRNYVIGKAEGAVGGKPLKKQAIADAMNYLHEHCYSLVRKKAPTEMSGLSVIPKTILESIDSEQIKGKKANKNDDPMAEIHTKLGESNMGFRLLEKMGWKGGSLGVRGDGIVDPVEATMKAGRRGLGHEKAIESEGKFSVKAVRQELYALRDGTQSQHIVFSKDFTKPERAKIHKMALGMGLKTKSFGSDKTGDRQLVVYALQLSPHQILKKVLVEKDTFYCEMYEAKCPTKLTA